MNNVTKNRAWIEINTENLKHNINEVKKYLHDGTEIMAVIKGNAYGHGLVELGKYLNSIGIDCFAVSELDEGIDLRKNGVIGNILILGYTDFSCLKYVIEYDLIQTIMDYEYSEEIKNIELPGKLKCHVKINTGMNRMGENYEDLNKIISIFENDKLDIVGTYSHLCTADSNNEEDIKYSKYQINNFDNCINELKNRGYNPGKLHLQSSYGVINYPELHYDYVRIGMFMYGLPFIAKTYMKENIDIKQILTLKTRVASIKKINAGDTVGYSRTYKADSDRIIATIAIGYTDGIPRALSNKEIFVKINGQYAKQIGRICMSQMIVDVTDIPNIKVGDEVLVLSDDENISIETMTKKINIANCDLINRLNVNLERIII